MPPLPWFSPAKSPRSPCLVKGLRKKMNYQQLSPYSLMGPDGQHPKVLSPCSRTGFDCLLKGGGDLSEVLDEKRRDQLFFFFFFN